jgi:hypothetical protein
MRKTKIILISILSVLVILSPLVITVSIGFLSAPVYEESFVGVLDEKVERLDSIEEEKIVVIGGSSVAFGIDSALIEKYTEMPVVNFGLYASLGTKLMLDLSQKSINRGDIVIIAPEMDAQTLSLYFNADATLKAFDGNFGLISRLKPDDFFKIMASSWDFAAEKLKYEAPATSNDVYSADSFNEFLDIDYERKHNVMNAYYDENLDIFLDKSIVSEEFIDYLNDYISYCRRRGAEVYFSWCPMNSLAVTNETEESLRQFQKYMEKEIDARFISNIEDYILEPEYFYDTNFHLNDAGMTLHSANLCRDILLELERPTLVDVEVEKPELPFFDVRYFDYDENEIYFTYKKMDGGAYMITGLSELGKGKTSLTVPYGYASYQVTAIAEGAFLGTGLEELIIPENTNLKLLMNGCFKGASKLSRLVIYHENQEDILPPYDFIGVASDFTVFVPEGSSYEIGYYWSERNLKFERIEK